MKARASIEEEYARKLLSLTRKALGSQETGTLKTSLDTVRGEVEQMAKQHQNIATQMKSELEEPLAAFSGGMKERRKIVQNTVEKLLKTKIQQTQQVNKVCTLRPDPKSLDTDFFQTRDRFEQDCLKIKGYLAQGHMVMGQEERRNKAKLEKTQISVATSNTEYEMAVKVLEETTGRWNREWKAAADKFQDLEEERLDFTKSSLWTFANISSTVCVSDDASCEKIRLSLEKMDVEKDIVSFIKDRGTGQEIPDAPRYINFCRGDVNDTQSEASEDENFSVAQFPRSINPAFRSSSPQPSTFESHHDPNSALANNLAHRDPATVHSREATVTPQMQPPPMQAAVEEQYHRQAQAGSGTYDATQHGPVAAVPHDPYPQDGMTMLCRTGPPSDRSSQVTSNRPSSRDEHSDYSNPTSISSYEPASGKTSPTKQDLPPAQSPEKRLFKKKSGFFQNHSPFRRKSMKEVQPEAPGNRNTWHASAQSGGSPARRPQLSNTFSENRSHSPEPIDANASVALGVGSNVLPVQTNRQHPGQAKQQLDESDPIAMALAELKGVTLGKQSSVRMSADHYHGIATPAPGNNASMSRSVPAPGGRDAAAAARGTPPPSYQQPGQQAPVSRLGVPPPAVTSKAMREATKKATSQNRSVFGDNSRGEPGAYSTSPTSRPGTRGTDMPRATSPAAARSASPQPQRTNNNSRQTDYRSASPNPYHGQQQRNSSYDARSSRGSGDYYRQSSPNDAARGGSPASYRDYQRPQSSYGGGDMAVQLAPAGDDQYGSQRGRGSGRPESRAMGLYNGDSRQRSKSVADPSRQYTRDGCPILHFGKCPVLDAFR